MIAYIKKLLNEIATLVSSTWNFLTGIWNLLVHFTSTLKTFIGNAEVLVADVLTEYNAISHITEPGNFDPKWKSRVISVPRAMENINELLQIPIDIVNNCKDIVQICKQKLEPEEFDPEELKFLPEEFGRFLGKILGWAGLVVDAFVAWNQALVDARHIVEDLRALRTNIEGLDALFLPQGNPKIVTQITYRKRQQA